MPENGNERIALAGSCPVSLAVAVAEAGGMGAMGALLSSPDAIANWAAEFRSQSLGPFQLNLWIADRTPLRDFAAEQRVREFLSSWGPTVPAEASGIQFPDFEKQCDSFVAIRPPVVPSIMGLYPYRVQLDLTAAMRQTGQDVKDVHRMPLWAGQSAAFARRESAGDFVRRTWIQAQEFLP